MFSRFREPVNGLTHFAGIIFAGIGMVWLQSLVIGDTPRMVIALVYSLCTMFTFTASTVMHLYVGSKRTIRWLIRLDHAAIFIMIAGNYTPVIYLMVDDPLRWWLLGGIWGCAIVGSIWKLLNWTRDSYLSTAIYLLMGWSVVFMLPDILPKIAFEGALLMAAGGVMYTLGAVVFALKRPNLSQWWGYHELWHMFVLAGCGLHFIGFAYYVFP